MWSTWRARRHFLKIQRNVLRGTHVAARIYQHTSAVHIPWRLTHLLHSKNYSKTRPLNTKFINIFSIFGRIILLLFNYSSFPFSSACSTNRLQYYIYTYNQQQNISKEDSSRRTTSANEFKVLLISPLKYWGIATISTTPPCPRLLEAFLESRLEWRTTHDWAINRELFFQNTRTYGRLPFLALPGT